MEPTTLRAANDRHHQGGQRSATEAEPTHDDHRDMHDRSDHPAPGGHGAHAGHDHSQMVADFRKRF